MFRTARSWARPAKEEEEEPYGEMSTQSVQACETMAFDCTRFKMSWRCWAACCVSSTVEACAKA